MTGHEAGATTPRCVPLPPQIGGEGHFCGQRAPAALHQYLWVIFFQTAVAATVPIIIGPFAE
jgi:hypothetical protein